MEVKAPVPLERGHEHPIAQFNDFKRCHTEGCRMGFFVNADAPQRGMIQCPHCDNVRKRLYP